MAVRVQVRLGVAVEKPARDLQLAELPLRPALPDEAAAEPKVWMVVPGPARSSEVAVRPLAGGKKAFLENQTFLNL